MRQAMKLTKTESRIRAELRDRHERGECAQIRDVDAIALADEDGAYLRITVELVDGSSFVIDTDEHIRVLH